MVAKCAFSRFFEEGGSKMFLRRWIGPLLAVGFALQGLACASGASRPKIQRSPHFQSSQLTGTTVLVLPIAVTDDLGDERTGIVLGRGSRESAAKAACQSVAQARKDLRVVCFEELRTGADAASARVALEFALGHEVPPPLLQSLAQASQAQFVLLFRPEKVGAGQDISDRYSAGDALQAGIVGMLLASAARGGPQRKITRGYTVSGVLIDLRSGRPAGAGIHAGEETTSSSAERKLGHAEVPPAARLLAEIQSDLAVSLVR